MCRIRTKLLHTSILHTKPIHAKLALLHARLIHTKLIHPLQAVRLDLRRAAGFQKLRSVAT